MIETTNQGLTGVQVHPVFWVKTPILFNIAMENGPFIDGLPTKNGDFP
jgi:hypothetical protein